MDILATVNTQYAIPIGVVLFLAVLLFVFGFKAPDEPAFDQLTNTGDDRKPAGKKRKVKDKKHQLNGHATAVGESQAEVKTSSAKPTKAEKSPVKEVSNKTSVKQQKKQEASPLKDKPFNKHKDSNKNEAELSQKQLKEKKQEVLNKSPTKDGNKNAVKSKGKGKENHVEEIKNKKNEKNLAKLKKAEGKPGGNDDGGWKEVLSSKDKKSRKQNEPEEIVPVKPMSKIEGTPKKKKSKNIELVLNAIAPVENKKSEERNNVNVEKSRSEIPEKVKSTDKSSEKKPEKAEKKKSDKQNEKVKKEESESKGEKIVDKGVNQKNAVVETKLSAESKSITESSDGAKSKKKNKKKIETKKEDVVETPKKLSQSLDKPVDKAAETIAPDKAAVFDELGDVWKEAVPKKNKKKVRKDQ